MKPVIVVVLFLLTCSAWLANADSPAAGSNPTPDQVEAKYTEAIEGRTAAILKVLDLSDTNRAAKVHDIVMAQYRSLKAWHEVNDSKLKAARGDTNAVAEIDRSLKVLHDNFLTELSAELTPTQVEQVKDKMTYGKVQFTYAGYLAQYPDLADGQKQKILELLKEAREQAMDAGSAEEKTAIFQKYKGRINNYLAQHGIHPPKHKPANKTLSDQ